ncbi:hypothetical protein PsorP6_006508 [Peronosclerospora sorghi]|uniref:Uncharacterized protein n=1 Tax=Peronosclerospora sorghi TaxID=230839 RepID=A0ACC0W4W6_9STRA|nr:hypothetical protein PsorP6_006508 [Peronosclerospora sorghi]
MAIQVVNIDAHFQYSSKVRFRPIQRSTVANSFTLLDFSAGKTRGLEAESRGSRMPGNAPSQIFHAKRKLSQYFSSQRHETFWHPIDEDVMKYVLHTITEILSKILHNFNEMFNDPKPKH